MENQTIGIKLADGSFYPILAEGHKTSMVLELTTVRDDQQTVQLDLYRSSDATMEHAEYVDTLLIENLLPRPREEPSIALKIDIDEDNTLSASIEDKESGESNSLTVSLLNLDKTRLSRVPDFALADEQNSNFEFADPSDIDEALADNAFVETIDIDEPLADNEFTKTIDIDEPLTDNAFSDTIDVDEDPADNTLTDESAFETDYIDGTIEEKAVIEEDLTEQVPQPQKETALFMSDTSIMEDVPRRKKETELTDFDIPESNEAAFVTEEEFPDFQDIPVTDSDEEPAVSPVEDESSLFDFGDDFNESSLDDSIPAPAFSFSDLYEEDDMEKEEKSSNKTLIPVIICIICAVISLAALALMFFGPFNSKNASDPASAVSVVTEPAAVEPMYTAPVVEPPPVIEPERVIEPEPVVEQEPVIEPAVEVFAESTVVEPAKENEVVKIEAEVVVPEVPVTPKKEESVSYKIKWGDTLWDLADSYYKNPWLYPKIAKFNGIRNPDLIISGTWISIPSK